MTDAVGDMVLGVKGVGRNCPRDVLDPCFVALSFLRESQYLILVYCLVILFRLEVYYLFVFPVGLVPDPLDAVTVPDQEVPRQRGHVRTPGTEGEGFCGT